MSDNNFSKTGFYPNPTITSEPMRAPPMYNQHDVPMQMPMPMPSGPPDYTQSQAPTFHPQAYHPQAPPHHQPGFGVIPPQPTHTTTVNVMSGNNVIAGTCPICQRGRIEKEFTCCGICCAIFLFPIGIICCCCWRRPACTNCDAKF